MQKFYICSTFHKDSNESDWRIALAYGDECNRKVNSYISVEDEVDNGPISTEHAYGSSVSPSLEW